jgi:hypothetical protein
MINLIWSLNMMSHTPHYILKYELPESQVILKIVYTPLQVEVHMHTHTHPHTDTAVLLQLIFPLFHIL